MQRVKLAVLGAGGRGTAYADYAGKYPQEAQVVAVAEPRAFYRERMASRHGIATGHVFNGWEELLAKGRLADAIIIATQDAMHAAPAVAAAELGYHILLEKPMAPNERDCRRIVGSAIKNGVILAVCHVLRYTAYTRKVKELIDSGLIGEVISLQHLEPVGYWHQAHAFVRGNWRNEAESSPMLLAKSCHDLDWIRYIMNTPCRKVHSFGTLNHFRKACRPAGAAEHCLACAVEPQCPYSAKKIYLGFLRSGRTGWPVNVLTPEVTEAGVTEALQAGPYGRCVYACDNDVVDNQVVSMLFAGGKTASFTMTAFSKMAGRRTTVFGSRGELRGDSSTLEHYDFLTDRTETIDTRASDASIAGGHGGGDTGLMQSFVAAVANEDPSRILSGPEETLETHLMVFAAERARRENRVVDLAELMQI
ncbi:MAG: Gfo/Idh/MocA family oxidoreductase [Kiritimatiellae bacterium]|nr:Gfo/Idh/MocA family oxidoreductase [Kiritimatiellia bacterium]